MNGILFVIDQLGANVSTLISANDEQRAVIERLRKEIEELKAKNESLAKGKSQ
jgi:FtsZ-binding cell division protein ZapB